MTDRKVVGVCYAGIGDEYQSEMINGLLEKQKDLPWLRLMFFTCFSDRFSGSAHDMGECAIFSLINYDKLDALILLSETIKDEGILKSIVDNANAANIPVVSLDAEIDGCVNILFDYANSIYDIVCHLVNVHKRSRINFITGVIGQDISTRRVEAYKRALESCGLSYDPTRVGEGMWWDEPTRETVRKWIDSGQEFDAVVCANDIMAMSAAEELEAHGISVPQQVSVTGIDDLEEARYHYPDITTARMGYKKGSAEALRLLEMIFGGENPNGRNIIRSDVIYRGSCGCKEVRPDANHYHRRRSNAWDDLNIFTRQIMRICSRITESSRVSDAVDKLRSTAMRAWTKKMWICVENGYFDSSSAAGDIVSQAAGTSFPQVMEVLAFKNDTVSDKCRPFETSELLPDLDRELDECRSVLFMPLHVNSRIIGYIAKEHTKSIYEHQWLLYSMNMSNAFSTLRQQAQLRHMIARLEDMYIRDSMTQLYNRRGFFSKLKELFVGGKTHDLTVASIDLDNLKMINDEYGHNEGDYAINAVAKALMSISVKGEICARFGGDEFIVAGIYDNDKYYLEYEKSFYEYLDYVNSNSSKPYTVSASFGIVAASSGGLDNIDELIKIADERMYKKKAGRSTSYRRRN